MEQSKKKVVPDCQHCSALGTLLEDSAMPFYFCTECGKADLRSYTDLSNVFDLAKHTKTDDIVNPVETMKPKKINQLFTVIVELVGWVLFSCGVYYVVAAFKSFLFWDNYLEQISTVDGTFGIRLSIIIGLAFGSFRCFVIWKNGNLK